MNRIIGTYKSLVGAIDYRDPCSKKKEAVNSLAHCKADECKDRISAFKLTSSLNEMLKNS
jgi:hypothetical protein